MDIISKRCCTALCSLLVFFLLSNNAFAGPENEYQYTGQAANTTNLYAANNPCATNPCAAKNPCAANPCGANPCGSNPCAAGSGIDPQLVTRPAGIAAWQGNRAELVGLGKKLWNDTDLSTNGLSCNTCHQGNAAFQPSFKQPYPHRVKMARDRAGMKSIALDEMVQLCLLVPMATNTVPWNSKRLAALTAYTEEVQKDFDMAAANPCGTKNPCAANPCAANPCGARNPCAANPCAANPCGARNPCAVNPCAANPCGASNPCAANPCAAANPCGAKNPCSN